jgi:hypothetical protein
VREEAFAQVEPDPLDRVELRAVGRQRQEGDGVGHAEPVRHVPAGLVEEEDGVYAGLELLGEVRQEHLHAGRGGLGQGEREGLIGAGPAGGKEGEARKALVGEPGRAHPARVPAMAGPSFLADARLILAPELEPRLRMRPGDGGERRAELLF